MMAWLTQSMNKATRWAIEMWTFLTHWVPGWSSLQSLYGHQEQWSAFLGFLLDEKYTRFCVVVVHMMHYKKYIWVTGYLLFLGSKPCNLINRDHQYTLQGCIITGCGGEFYLHLSQFYGASYCCSRSLPSCTQYNWCKAWFPIRNSWHSLNTEVTGLVGADV